MLSSLLGAQRPIGCDFERGGPRLVQVNKSGRLISAGIPFPDAQSEMPDVASAASLVSDLLNEGAFAGRTAVICLPNDLLTFRTLRMGPMPHAELQSAVHWKLVSEVGLAADQFTSQIVTVTKVSEGGKPRIEVLAVCAKHEHLSHYLDIAVKAGLNPAAIDVSTCAIARVVSSPQEADAKAGNRLMLHLEQRSETLAVVARGEVVFARALGAGIERLWQLLAQRLQLSLEEARFVTESDGVIPQEQAQRLSVDQVRAAIGEAAHMYARDLSRGISLTLNYFEESLGGAAPEAALVAGSCKLPGEALSSINLQTGLSFEPVSVEHLPAGRASLTGNLTDGISPWLSAMGLSQYSAESVLSKEAA